MVGKGTSEGECYGTISSGTGSGGGITNDAYARNHGIYIRCVSEEKDVSDLTYMQDMTPSVAANIAERTALSTILQELCVIVNVLRA